MSFGLSSSFILKGATLLFFLCNLNFVAAVTIPDSFTIQFWDHPQCPYDISVSVPPDVSSFDILYSTKANASSSPFPSYLAAYGSNVPTTDHRRKCYVNIGYKFGPRWDMDLKVTGVELQATGVRLEEGIVANVETSLTFNTNSALESFTTVGIPGPVLDNQNVFNYTLTNTSSPQVPYCTDQFYGEAAFHLVSVFSVSPKSEAKTVTQGNQPRASSGSGELVKNGYLKQRIMLNWTAGCNTSPSTLRTRKQKNAHK